MLPVRVRRSWLACAATLWLAACTAPPASPPAPPQPEAASAQVAKPGWATRTYAVAAANPLATQAGLDMLRMGGSAVDAAIAVQMVLTLVEPQSSGIGGGAFLLHYDGQRTQAFDGRETAPAAATPTLFLGPDGKPLPFWDAVVGGRSVGVPGTVSMLSLAHQQHGRLPWAQLFAPTIRLARDGFAISPRMATLLASEQALKNDPVAGAYFYDPQGRPWPAGHVLRNPELAAVLQGIATEGPDALMRGDVARAIAAKVQRHPTNPGTLTEQDLAGYSALVREPLCFDYRVADRHDYRLCGMPPPSSGTLAIGQILGLLNHTPAATLPLQNGVPSGDWLHLYTEASRLAFTDRAQYVADPAFVEPPAGDWASLLAPDYLRQRARLIGTSPDSKAMPTAPAGEPGAMKVSYAPMPQQPEYGTSHISVVDAYGNALAMTTTIEDGWGSRLMVNRGVGLSGGFLLNNELTDFSLSPTDASGKPVANRVEPGKRPRSSMSPTLVFDKATGQLVASAGSPGGALIIHFTAKTLYGVLNWNLDTQQAINLPNFGSLGGPLLLEDKRFSPATVQALRARGHTVVETPMPSGLQAIQRTPTGYFGGADPRREGVVLGD
ncbi:MAG: gamma-glutamyltransferase family protein [Burkholderiales bacterium]|nr:gamma-glutamyltransferase family protein [Burkholderiales bacterium]